MKRKLIAITGKAGAGKDTIGNYLYSAHDFRPVAYATALKRAVMEMFNLTHDQVYDEVQKEIVDPRWGMTPRRILQLFGTEAVKPVFGKDVWVRRLMMEINALPPERPVVITDLRFDEEAEAVKAAGGKIINVVRPTHLEGAPAAHLSEAGIAAGFVDVIIHNNGTVDELFLKVDHALDHFTILEQFADV